MTEDHHLDNGCVEVHALGVLEHLLAGLVQRFVQLAVSFGFAVDQFGIQAVVVLVDHQAPYALQEAADAV